MVPSRDVSLTSKRFGSASDARKDIAAAALVQKAKVVKFTLFVSAYESYEVVFSQWLRLMLPLEKESSITDYMDYVSSFPRDSSHVSDAERVSLSAALDHYHAETNYYQQLLTGKDSEDFISRLVPSRDIEARLAHDPMSLLLGDCVPSIPVLVAIRTALRLFSEGAILVWLAARASTSAISEGANVVSEGASPVIVAEQAAAPVHRQISHLLVFPDGAAAAGGVPWMETSVSILGGKEVRGLCSVPFVGLLKEPVGSSMSVAAAEMVKVGAEALWRGSVFLPKSTWEGMEHHAYLSTVAAKILICLAELYADKSCCVGGITCSGAQSFATNMAAFLTCGGEHFSPYLPPDVLSYYMAHHCQAGTYLGPEAMRRFKALFRPDISQASSLLPSS